MEGFRVLPYGDAGDDSLEIDRDYTQRLRSLRFLSNADPDLSRFGEGDEDFGLTARRNSSYFGAVFLTTGGTSKLDMLVNREGFIPNSAFMSLQRLVRVGVDLSLAVLSARRNLAPYYPGALVAQVASLTVDVSRLTEAVAERR